MSLHIGYSSTTNLDIDPGVSEEDTLELLALLEAAGLVRRTGDPAADSAA